MPKRYTRLLLIMSLVLLASLIVPISIAIAQENTGDTNSSAVTSETTDQVDPGTTPAENEKIIADPVDPAAPQLPPPPEETFIATPINELIQSRDDDSVAATEERVKLINSNPNQVSRLALVATATELTINNFKDLQHLDPGIITNANPNLTDDEKQKTMRVISAYALSAARIDQTVRMGYNVLIEVSTRLDELKTAGFEVSDARAKAAEVEMQMAAIEIQVNSNQVIAEGMYGIAAEDLPAAAEEIKSSLSIAKQELLTLQTSLSELVNAMN